MRHFPQPSVARLACHPLARFACRLVAQRFAKVHDADRAFFRDVLQRRRDAKRILLLPQMPAHQNFETRRQGLRARSTACRLLDDDAMAESTKQGCPARGSMPITVPAPRRRWRDDGNFHVPRSTINSRALYNISAERDDCVAL